MPRLYILKTYLANLSCAAASFETHGSDLMRSKTFRMVARSSGHKTGGNPLGKKYLSSLLGAEVVNSQPSAPWHLPVVRRPAASLLVRL